MKFKSKGALFGLDARVALAIFGVLSIITGTALYKSFQEASVTAILAEMNNINKAFTNYLIDTGTYPKISPDANGSNGGLKIEELITSSMKNWDGPYISLTDNWSDTDGILEHPTYNNITAYSKADMLWSSPFSSSTKCLLTSDTCFIYICYNGITENMKKLLDIKIDGTTSAQAGNFRYSASVGCKKGINYDKNLAPSS